MNCIKDGKYTGDSCFGCPVKVDECEIRDKVYRKRWIPVKDQLPPGKKDVLICTRNGWILVSWYGPNGERWHISPTGAEYLPPDVVAWMPLPEPFTQQNYNCPVCGEKLDPMWDYCPWCGQPVMVK